MVIPVIAISPRWGLDNPDGFGTQFLFFEGHEFGDESDVGRDPFAAFKDEGVGTGEGPVVCVDKVGDDGCYRARFAGFAVDIGWG